MRKMSEQEMEATILLHQYAFHEIEELVGGHACVGECGNETYPVWAQKVMELADKWK